MKYLLNNKVYDTEKAEEINEVETYKKIFNDLEEG